MDQKQQRKGGDTTFPIISQWGLSIAMDTVFLIQLASKHYAAFSIPQVMLHIKFDPRLAIWPRLFKFKIVKLSSSKVCNFKASCLIWPEIKLIQAFMRLSYLTATLMMIQSKMNELAWRHHYPIVSLWEIF